MKREAYSGGDFYKNQKKLVGVIVYIRESVRNSYKEEAARLRAVKKRGSMSAQKLMAAVLTKNRPHPR